MLLREAGRIGMGEVDRGRVEESGRYRLCIAGVAMTKITAEVVNFPSGLDFRGKTGGVGIGKRRLAKHAAAGSNGGTQENCLDALCHSQ